MGGNLFNTNQRMESKEEFINTINEIQKEVFNEGIDAAVETIIEIQKESFNEDMDKAVEVDKYIFKR